MMTEYHAVVKRHQFGDILKQAGLTHSDMPVLQGYTNSAGRSSLCWNFLTGVCFYGKNCNFAAGHVVGNHIPDGFIEEAITKIKPGVDGLVKSIKEYGNKLGGKRPGAPPRSGYYGPGGDSNKKR